MNYDADSQTEIWLKECKHLIELVAYKDCPTKVMRHTSLVTPFNREITYLSRSPIHKTTRDATLCIFLFNYETADMQIMS
jgi:hypothetical protein